MFKPLKVKHFNNFFFFSVECDTISFWKLSFLFTHSHFFVESGEDGSKMLYANIYRKLATKTGTKYT